MHTPGKLKGPRTAIILLNWNGWQDTVACADSLLLCDSQNFVLVLCDNGSTDDSWQQLCIWGRALDERFTVWSPGQAWSSKNQVVLVQTGGNLGFAGGCNVGLRFALQQTGCEYFWLLNNDTIVEKESLSHLVRCMQRDTGLGLLGATLIFDGERDRVQCFGGYGFNTWTARVRPFAFPPDPRRAPSPAEVEAIIRYVSGASTFVSRHFVEQVGLLNEQYFLYFEEIDWAVRGCSFGMGYCPESIVFHKEGRSIGSARAATARSRQSELWLTRNRVLFMRTHFPARLPITLLWISAVALIRACTGKLGIAETLLQGLWRGLIAPKRPIPDPLQWPPETLQAAKQTGNCDEPVLQQGPGMSSSLTIHGRGSSAYG